MAFNLADWIASATASVKLAPVTNNKAITDTESEITTDVLFKGLNVTPTRIGFYDGSAWVSYFESTGYFFFKGDDRNYLSWDGSIFTVEGIQASFGEAIYDPDKSEYVYRNPIISGGRIKETSRENVTTISSSDIEKTNTSNTNESIFGKYYYTTATKEYIRDSFNSSDNGLLSCFYCSTQWLDETNLNNYSIGNAFSFYSSGTMKSVGRAIFSPKDDISFSYPPIEIIPFSSTSYNSINRPTWSVPSGSGAFAVDGNGVLWFKSGTIWKIVTLT